MIMLILQIRKLSPREIKCAAQGHTVGRWLREDLNPGHLTLESMPLAIFSAASSLMLDVQHQSRKGK